MEHVIPDALAATNQNKPTMPLRLRMFLIALNIHAYGMMAIIAIVVANVPFGVAVVPGIALIFHVLMVLVGFMHGHILVNDEMRHRIGEISRAERRYTRLYLVLEARGDADATIGASLRQWIWLVYRGFALVTALAIVRLVLDYVDNVLAAVTAAVIYLGLDVLGIFMSLRFARMRTDLIGTFRRLAFYQRAKHEAT